MHPRQSMIQSILRDIIQYIIYIIYILYITLYIQTRSQLVFPRVAESLSKWKPIIPKINLSGPRLSVPSPNRLSVPSPNRQELRAPLYPLGLHPPNPMPPRLRYFGEGNRPGLTPVFNGISPLREILARLSEIVKNERPLSLLGSDCIGSGREEGRGRVSRAQSSVEIDTDSCLVMGALNQTRPQLVFPRVAESLSKWKPIIPKINLSGPRLSVPSPNRQELRAPLYPL